MASLLLRLGLKQGCRPLQRCTPVIQQIRTVKTTKKEETTFVGLHPEVKKHGVDDKLDKDENWIAYGYNNWDRAKDSTEKHLGLFSTITIGFVGVLFVVMYLPDFKLRDWSQREAFLLIEERERKGLPLVDPHFIPPEKMEQQLPSDEELGEAEIIV